MSGVLFGERVVELSGTAKFIDHYHHLAGELNFDANTGFLSKSQGDDIKGHIHCTKKGTSKVALSIIHGSWLSHLQCDQKVYWHVESEPAFQHVGIENPLESDSCFREDLIALENQQMERAQDEKLRLEQLQRHDHTLRQ